MSQRNSTESAIKVGANFMEAWLTGTVDVEKTAETEDITPIGATVVKEAFTGVTSMAEVTFEGIYGDGATEPDGVFGAIGTTASVIFGYSGGGSQTKKTTVTMGLKSYKRSIIS